MYFPENMDPQCRLWDVWFMAKVWVFFVESSSCFCSNMS